MLAYVDVNPWAGQEEEQGAHPPPPPPGKWQVAIGFLRTSMTDPLEKQSGPLGPIASRGRFVPRAGPENFVRGSNSGVVFF